MELKPDKLASEETQSPAEQWETALREAGWWKCNKEGYAFENRKGKAIMTEKQHERWRQKGRVPTPEEVNAELSELVDMLYLERVEFPDDPIICEGLDELLDTLREEVQGDLDNGDFFLGDKMKVITIYVGQMTRREVDLMPEFEGW